MYSLSIIIIFFPLLTIMGAMEKRDDSAWEWGLSPSLDNHQVFIRYCRCLSWKNPVCFFPSVCFLSCLFVYKLSAHSSYTYSVSRDQTIQKFFRTKRNTTTTMIIIILMMTFPSSTTRSPLWNTTSIPNSPPRRWQLRCTNCLLLIIYKKSS